MQDPARNCRVPGQAATSHRPSGTVLLLDRRVAGGTVTSVLERPPWREGTSTLNLAYQVDADGGASWEPGGVPASSPLWAQALSVLKAPPAVLKHTQDGEPHSGISERR